jgi:hypothetical protein
MVALLPFWPMMTTEEGDGALSQTFLIGPNEKADGSDIWRSYGSMGIHMCRQ